MAPLVSLVLRVGFDDGLVAICESDFEFSVGGVYIKHHAPCLGDIGELFRDTGMQFVFLHSAFPYESAAMTATWPSENLILKSPSPESM